MSATSTPGGQPVTCAYTTAPGRVCGIVDGVRPYLPGPRCAEHAPGAPTSLAGRVAQLRDAALSIAARGWPVFPLWPATKVPALHGAKTCPGSGVCADGHQGWEQRATTDPDRIAGCWAARPYGVGIACGPAGLVVVDLDIAKGGRTSGFDTWEALADAHGGNPRPHTVTVTTPSGGRHLYYAAPAGVELHNTTGSLGAGIDTRAVGGQVVAPPTPTRQGVYTATSWPTELPVLPDWLTRLLTPAPLPPARPVVVALHGRGRGSAWLDAAVRRQLDHLTAAPAGRRNEALYLSAVALGQLAAGGALSERDVYDLLTQACLSADLRPKTSTIASGLRAGSRRPRSVPA